MIKDENNLKKIGKSTIITVLISIALNPISIFLGYYIGKSLERPKLSIEYAEVKVDTRPIEINQSVISPIQGNLILTSLLEKKISYRCDDFIKDRKLGIDCFDEIIEGIDQVIEIFEFEKRQIQPIIDKIKAWLPGQNLIIPIIQIPGLTEKPIQHYVSENKQGTLNAFQGYLDSSLDRRQELERLRTEIENLKGTKKSVRTGDSKIVVGILNSGDSDGVISPSSKLLYGGSELLLHTKDSDFIVINAHSFKKLTFEIDIDHSSGGSLKKWKSLLINHNQEPFTVKINSPSGSFSADGRIPE